MGGRYSLPFNMAPEFTPIYVSCPYGGGGAEQPSYRIRVVIWKQVSCSRKRGHENFPGRFCQLVRHNARYFGLGQALGAMRWEGQNEKLL